MNKQQLQSLIVEPTLQDIPNGYSASAVVGFMMTVAHESQRGEYVRQWNCCGDVGAFGQIQMEKLTHDETWKEGDSIWENALNAKIINAKQYQQRTHPKVERLIYDIAYNVFMWRQRMFMKPERFPDADDIVGWSKYLKLHWNSIHGAATDYSYKEDYERWQ